MTYSPTIAGLVPGVKALPCGALPGDCSASIPMACEGCGNNPDLRSDYCGRTAAECAEAGGTGDCDLCRREASAPPRKPWGEIPEALMHPEDDR